MDSLFVSIICFTFSEYNNDYLFLNAGYIYITSINFLLVLFWTCHCLVLWFSNSNLLLQIPANGCAVNGELDIAVDFIAPSCSGRYISYWRMASPSGQKFGQRVWVLIQVLVTIST